MKTIIKVWKYTLYYVHMRKTALYCIVGPRFNVQYRYAPWTQILLLISKCNLYLEFRGIKIPRGTSLQSC